MTRAAVKEGLESREAHLPQNFLIRISAAARSHALRQTCASIATTIATGFAHERQNDGRTAPAARRDALPLQSLGGAAF